MHAERRTLANGLRVNVIRDVTATRAAALFQLSAGSHDAPLAFPGLAHLLEHVLFAGSARFQQAERLMSWAPAAGAKLNATTLAHHTAWFFECDAPQLADGFARLLDMLAQPLLHEAAIAQEVAVIDAEYRMLTSHAETLCEAALAQAVAPPHRLHDFHVGNRAVLGDDTAALHQALRAFHQRFFCGDRLELWLQGPQSTDALFALAAQAGSAFTAASAPRPAPVAPLRLAPAPDRALHLSGLTRGYFTFPLTVTDRSQLAVLGTMLTDSAEGGLLATLRAEGLCDQIRLLETFRGESGSLISVQFDGADAEAARTGSLFFSWLRQLAATDSAQYAHYAALTVRHFHQRNVLDQLRDRAFGFPAPASLAFNAPCWQTLTGAITPDTMARLWVSPEVRGEAFTAQGFALTGEPLPPLALSPAPARAPSLHRPSEPLSLPAIPVAVAPLLQIPAAGDALLLIAPQPGQPFSRQHAAQTAAALEPIAGALAHQGGSAVFTREQGRWLLQLSGPHSAMCGALAGTLAALLAEPSARALRLVQQAAEAVNRDVAIRVLLDRLPDCFQPDTELLLSALHWQATLYGGTADTHQTLAHLLSGWPGNWQPAPAAQQPAALRICCPTTSTDAAVLVFVPLPDRDARSLAAWQVLGSVIEPRFFQRYRVERNLGYVVSARFHCTANQPGILFALQSPAFAVDQLEAAISDFIDELRDDVSLFVDKAASLAAPKTRFNAPLTAAQRLAHWHQQQQAHAPFNGVLTRDDLRAACQQLCHATTPRITLHNKRS